jgi:hypothetical protein
MEATATQPLATRRGGGQPTINDIRQTIAAQTTEELRAELTRLLGFTADSVLRLAAVIAELESRGEDLSDLKIGLLPILREVAVGRLAAEAVVAFAGRRVVLRALVGVPLGMQRRLAAGESVAVIDPNDPKSVSEYPLVKLPAAAVPLVFVDGEIRDPAAQRLALRQRQKPAPAPAARHYRPRYDSGEGAVRVGRMKVPVAELVHELASASGPDHPPADIPEEYDVVRGRLTHEEYARFQIACRRSALPEWEMVRKALRAFGLI